jgi:hypothetical protein
VSYLRPIREEELSTWLKAVEYDTLDAEFLAHLLVDKFDILITSNKAQ